MLSLHDILLSGCVTSMLKMNYIVKCNVSALGKNRLYFIMQNAIQFVRKALKIPKTLRSDDVTIK